MTRDPVISEDGRLITKRIPFAIVKRGGRKLVIAPVEDGTWAPPRHRIDNTLVRALARAHRWKRMLESSKFDSVSDLAKSEDVNESYVCRLLRLTLLAPDIVETILNGRQSQTIKLAALIRPIDAEWEKQRRKITAREEI